MERKRAERRLDQKLPNNILLAGRNCCVSAEMYTPDAGNIHWALSHLEQALRILASSEDRQEVHPVWTAVPGTESQSGRMVQNTA